MNNVINVSKFAYVRAVEHHAAVIVMAKDNFPRIPCQYIKVKVIFDVHSTTPQGLDKMINNMVRGQLTARWNDLRKAGMLLPDLSEHTIHITPISTKVASI